MTRYTPDLLADDLADLTAIRRDIHRHPETAFEVVVEIFTQFSTRAERALNWAGMRKALKPGGLLILQGYTPKQLQFGTGGPKDLENPYPGRCSSRASGRCNSPRRSSSCTRGIGTATYPR